MRVMLHRRNPQWREKLASLERPLS